MELVHSRVGLPGWFAALGLMGVLAVAACSDEAGGAAGCPAGEEWHPIEEQCVPERDNGSDNVEPGDAGNEDDGNDQGGDAGNDDNDSDCVGPDCPAETCDPADGEGTIAGVVTIPSGELPLPDVSVYVPQGELEDAEEGASCVQCEDELSAAPVTDTLTGPTGQFELDEVPEGEDIQLVVEVGKWRRTTTVGAVEPCETTEVDPVHTRLPSNRDEGQMPRFAVTTGECDAVACLLRKIGIDDSEFTTNEEGATDGSVGAVHMFEGRTSDADEDYEGPTNRFAQDFNDYGDFPAADEWWDDADNLLDYDVMINSCECSAIPKSDDAAEAFEQFTDAGGRAFLTHYHYTWLRDGPDEMETVADWNTIAGVPGGLDQTATGYINYQFPKGLMLRDWMYETGTTPQGEFDIHHVRGSVDSINEEIAQEWVTIEDEGDFDFPIGDSQEEYIQYFSFNTPLDVDDDQQCGRVVFSDIHVSGREVDFSGSEQDTSGDSYPFPEGCRTDDLSDQEKALVFMLFDLSACILPDDKQKGQW